MKTRKLRPMTLLEIMIVIFIIGIIGSVIGYSMKGSLEEGKAFKSEQGSKQVYEILTLEMAKGGKLEDILANPLKYLESSGFAKNPKSLLQDGWGGEYLIVKKGYDDIAVISMAYIKHRENKGKDIEDIKEKYPWMVSEDALLP
ncbi:MAG: type II secretion system protein [Chlamydiae bacterium]|nr:type II secretion system protein [Chlamydiota bacterium]